MTVSFFLEPQQKCDGIDTKTHLAETIYLYKTKKN